MDCEVLMMGCGGEGRAEGGGGGREGYSESESEEISNTPLYIIILPFFTPSKYLIHPLNFSHYYSFLSHPLRMLYQLSLRVCDYSTSILLRHSAVQNFQLVTIHVDPHMDSEETLQLVI
ncbi:hypothetical protein Droror1_Dr00013094 [Drosera rotundifolia]